MFFTNLAILVAVQLLSHDALGGSITPSPPKRRLVVLITVDQLRPDYFDRYRAQWTGGFKRILDGGVFFTDGRQDHALTETAPGH